MDLHQLQAQAEYIARQVVAERCKVDLYYLCKYILGGESVLDPKVHGPLCRALRPLLFYTNPARALEHEYPSDYGREEHEGLPTPEEKLAFLRWQQNFMPGTMADAIPQDKFNIELNRLLALMPRGTLKSTVITIGFTIQWLLNYPNDRVLIDSETYTKSKAFLSEITGHYESNEKLREVYGTIYQEEDGSPMVPDRNRKHDTWSTEMLNLSCRARKRKEPSIDCAGIDVTKNGMHYDLIIGDDLHSEKNTKNPEQIENVKTHFKLLYSLLDPGKSMCIIGTRWDDDDLYQMIIDDFGDSFNFITRSAESEDGSMLFFPSRLNRVVLDGFRKIQGSYIYSCQYLNNPVDPETAKFKKHMFKYLKMDEIKGQPINWYLLVDPSYAGEKSDYAAFVIAGMGTRREIYYRYVFKDKMTYSQIIDKMYELWDMFNPLMVQLEVIGTKSLEHDLQKKQEERAMSGRSRMKVRLIRHHARSKEERIEALTPHYERGDVYHIVGGGMMDALEGELLRFPKSKNDDVSDCASGILDIGTPPRGGLLDERARQKRDHRLKLLKKPRSPMVGY